MEEFITDLVNWISTTGVRIIISLVILAISCKVINSVSRKVEKKLLDKGHDKTLVQTLSYIARILLKVVVCTCLVGYLGIDTSGLAALIASLGVCIGLAVNGALSNLAGGVLILVTRPFKIGDYIEAQGVCGTVENIKITCTKVVTVDNKVIYLPNGALSSGSVINYSEKDARRVDFTFSVAGNDPEKVKAILTEVCDKEEKVAKDPAVFVRVSDYGAGNGVKVTLRAWTKTELYWDTYFDLLSAIQTEFDRNGIVIPFNQLDVHIKN